MNRKMRNRLLLLLAFTCVVRICVLFALGEQLSASIKQDVDLYLHLGTSLADSSTYALDGNPTAFRPALYPVLLAVGLKLGLSAKLWIVILHLLLAVGTVWITVLLGQQIKNEKTGWLAGLLVTFDPILLNQSVLVMTETLATFLAVLSIWRVAKLLDHPGLLNGLLTAIAFGLAGYCRPTFYVYALLTLVLLLFTLQTSLGKRLMTTFAMGCVVLLTLSPWVYRNYQLFDKPVLATTHGGYTLLLGNNPLYYQQAKQQLNNSDSIYEAQAFDEGVLRFNVSEDPGFDFWSAEASLKEAIISRNEVERDAFCYAVAFHHIRANQVSFANGCLTRLKAFWTPLPAEIPGERSDIQRYAVGLWYVLIYLLVANFTLFHTRKWAHSGLLAGLSMIIAFSLMHTVFWSNMRMRAPLIPVLCLVAAISFLGTRTEADS